MKLVLKKLGYIFITIVLIMSFLSIFILRSTEQNETVRVWDKEALVSIPTTRYEVVVTDSYVKYAQAGDDPQMLFEMSGELCNVLYVDFAEPLDEELEAQLYYTSGEYFSEPMSLMGKRLTDQRLIFCLPNTVERTAFRLDINGDFSLTQVTVEHMPIGSVKIGFNIIAFAVFAVGMLVLILTERRVKYFSWAFTGVRHELEYLRALASEEKKSTLILHVINWGFTALFVAFLAVMILFVFYTKVTILIAFGLALIAVALQLIDRITSGNGAEPAKLFLIIAILSGIMMCYAIPPCTHVSWDDETHFRKAFTIIHPFTDEISVTEYRLFHCLYGYDDYMRDPDAFVKTLVQQDTEYIDYKLGGVNPYTAFGYIPMILTNGILALLGADIAKILVLCRLANLAIYSSIVYYGIRKLKSGASIFSAVCLLPSVLFLACSLSYDFWIIAWFAYGFAYLISELQQTDKKLQTIDLIKLLVVFFVGCGPKGIYCAMMLPLLFLKKDKFENPQHAKKFRLWTIGVILLIAAILIIPGLVVSDFYTDTRGGSDVSTGGQISFILTHPFQYVYILLKFLSEYCSFSQMNTFVGYYAYLGNAHVFFGTVAAFMLMYCTFTDRKEEDGYETMQSTRWITMFSCFVQIVLIATSLYVGFTPVGLNTINGCQYRYIFPLLIPFCFFLAPSKIKCNINPKFQNAFVYGGLAFSVLMSFFSAYVGRF